MPGTQITDRQVRRYMEHRRQGNTQFVAAAKSGFSERSARRIEAARVLPSQRDKRPRGRTRPDPLADVWRNELVPMLRAHPHLRATTLLEDLQSRYPERYPTVCCAPCSGGSQPGVPPRVPSGRSSSARSIPRANRRFGFHRRLELTGDDRRRAVRASAVPLLAGVFGLAVRQGDPGWGKASPR